MDTVFLNHAGTSWPKPQGVVNAVHQAIDVDPAMWLQQFENAHAAVCSYFHVASTHNMLLTPGCTSSLSTAIHSADVVAGQCVLTSRWEHHAIGGPLHNLQRHGITVNTIPTTETSLLDLNWLEHRLKQHDVGLVAITAACNVTGDILPFRDVVELAHRYKTQVLLDAAQIVGWLDLNLDQLNADFVAFGGHKGLQAPWGIGGLYMSESARTHCGTATCEIPSNSSAESGYQNRPGYCDVGSVNRLALAGLESALNWLSQSTAESRLQKAQHQAAEIEAVLAEDCSVTLHSKTPIAQRLPTIAFTVAGEFSFVTAERLQRQGLHVASGLQCAPMVHEALGTTSSGVVRLSLGPQQSAADIQKTISVTQTVLTGETETS